MTAVLEAPEQTRPARTIRTIPMSRIVGVELRKMFDTRSGFWLMASIAITSLVATGAVIAVAPDDALTYEVFASAIGFPMSVVLPMIAILSVTGEYTQRSGLTTFTLVPHRGKVIAAKAIGAVGIGVASMVVAMVIGAVGHVVGTAIAGVDTSWNVPVTELLSIVLANVLGLMIGFTLGVLIRNSSGAIVGYFVYALLLPTAFALLAAYQQWFADLQPWIDFNYAQGALFEGGLTSEQWAQLGVAGVIWLVVPLAVGLRLALRSEVK